MDQHMVSSTRGPDVGGPGAAHRDPEWLYPETHRIHLFPLGVSFVYMMCHCPLLTVVQITVLPTPKIQLM